MAALIVAAFNFAQPPCLAAGAEDGITLGARRGPDPLQVTLEWTGGEPTFEVFRADRPGSVVDLANKLGETADRSFTDAGDPPTGGVFYYVVTGGLDRVPPLITATPVPAPNANGWNNSDVVVSFECSDAGSGIATCPPPVTLTAEGADQLVTGTAEDLAGNSSTTSIRISIDRTLPALAITAPSEPVIYADPTPEVRVEYSDALSGIDPSALVIAVDGAALAGCQVGGSSATCEPPPLPPGTRTVSAETRDRAGNAATARFSFELSEAPPPLDIQIAEPSAGLLTRQTSVRVSGTVSPLAESVEVNGIAAVLGSGAFAADSVPLREGNNTLTAVARNSAGATGTASVTVVRDTDPPTVFIESPSAGQIVNAASVAVVGLVNDVVTGTVNEENCRVVISGRAGSVSAVIRNRTFLVESFPLVPGPNTLTAVATDTAGNVSAPFEVEVVRQELAGQRIDVVSGNNQSGAIGSVLPVPLVVSLTGAGGNPVPGRSVTFRVSRGDGTLTGAGREGREIHLLTDAVGRAQVSFRLGARSGAGNQRVTATATGFAGEASFCASALDGVPSRIELMSGENQRGVVGEPLPLPFVVFVHDEGGNPIEGVPVVFEVTLGGGNIAASPSFTDASDSDGLAEARITLGPEAGINNNRVQARFEGLAGMPAMLLASGMAPGPAQDTRVSGVVLDNTDSPLPNVTMRIAGTGLETLTDSQGQFTIPGGPVGSVHLVADGSTTTRPGLWPVLAFDLTTVSGQDNTIGMPIYLLPLDTERARLVGGPEDVTLTMANVPGFEVTVLANSVTCPDGSGQCLASITQVHRDKVPMPPPRGAAPRLVLTVQPPGIHFDPPARVTYPNVDDLPPGRVADFYSFDHDLGQFISVGTATVSEDGSVVVSDPGSGIREGGWHYPEPPDDDDDCGTTGCPECQTVIAVDPDTCSITCAPVGDGSPCDDGNDCTMPDHCENGACVPGDPVTVERVDGACVAAVGDLALYTARANFPSEAEWMAPAGTPGSGQGEFFSTTFNEPGETSVTAFCDSSSKSKTVTVEGSCSDVPEPLLVEDISRTCVPCPGCFGEVCTPISESAAYESCVDFGRWCFRLGIVTVPLRWGVQDRGKTDITSAFSSAVNDNLRDFGDGRGPRPQYCKIIEDLTPNLSSSNGRPARDFFLSSTCTIQHEVFHMNDLVDNFLVPDFLPNLKDEVAKPSNCTECKSDKTSEFNQLRNQLFNDSFQAFVGPDQRAHERRAYADGVPCYGALIDAIRQRASSEGFASCQ